MQKWQLKSDTTSLTQKDTSLGTKQETQNVNLIIQSCWLPGYISQFQNTKFQINDKLEGHTLLRNYQKAATVTLMTCSFP